MFFHRRTDFTITSTGAGHYLAFVLALLFLAQVNPTQGQAQQKEDQVRIVTDLIQLDVVVTDAQGRLVRDLKSDDFTLLADGRPQQITHFAIGTAARQATRLNIRNSGAGNVPDLIIQAQIFASGRLLQSSPPSLMRSERRKRHSLSRRAAIFASVIDEAAW